MKMKKIVCAMVSAALLVSMAAATAFAVESVPSKTGTDADAGKTEVSASGSVSSEGLQVEVKTTEDSSKEETQLKGEGVEKYLTAEAVDAAAKILGSEKDAIDRLSPREKTIVELRYGLKNAEGEEMTQKEVADRLGISQSYISRLEKKIMKRLKKEIVRFE